MTKRCNNCGREKLSDFPDGWSLQSFAREAFGELVPVEVWKCPRCKLTDDYDDDDDEFDPMRLLASTREDKP